MYSIRTSNKLKELETAVNDILKLTSAYGENKDWTNPFLSVWSVEGKIDDLLYEIKLEIENVWICTYTCILFVDCL